MSARRLIVLKFGGSVLRDEDTLSLAVHEIQRWRRDDYRVVAVVSALAGTTEELLRSCRRFAPESADHAVAAVIAGGELHCAALLGLHLDRAGIPARVLSPGAIGLISDGPALNAEPKLLNSRPIQDALDSDEVVVVPGFVAHDKLGRTVVLGRGGSDLTALFLASRLRAARCRLVKDVDGLYDRDPATPGTMPDRYASVSWHDALKTDGAIVQHKAIRFARAHGLTFELGNVNGVQPTLVGAGPTELDLHRRSSSPLRVALLGLGTVGGGLYELLKGMPDLFEVTSVLVREPHRPRDVEVDANLLTTDARAAVKNVDIVVEAIGGTSPAKELIECSLMDETHVVTANKAVVAENGEALAELARVRCLHFLRSATVGGCAPLLERLAMLPEDVRCVRGVLNGTVNFVLEGLADRRELVELLQDACRRGFAEDDATRDLSGQDAADKVSVIAGVLGCSLGAGTVKRDVLDEATASRARRAAAAGLALRQVATLRIEHGNAHGRVTLEELEANDPLASTLGEHNSVVIERAGGLTEIVRGKGAGRWPTAESLMGDLLQIAREQSAVQAPRAEAEASAKHDSALLACVADPS